LRICEQEERTTYNTEIRVEEERIAERRREDMTEEEGKFNNTLQGRVSIPISLTTSSQSGGHKTKL